MKYWRLVAGDKYGRSIILGDWIRKEYIAVGFEDPNHITRKRFSSMEEGDKVVIVAEGYVYAVGELIGDEYEKAEPDLYLHRRDTEWYMVTRTPYTRFPTRLKNKLQNPHTLLELSEDEWETLMMCLK